MAFLMRRLQVSAISCSSLSPALNSRGLPTAIARVNRLPSWPELVWGFRCQADFIVCVPDFVELNRARSRAVARSP